MTRLALAFAAGAAWVLIGAPLTLAPLPLLTFLLLPNEASRRPGSTRVVWVCAALAGAVSAALGTHADACGGAAADGRPTALEGHFLAAPRGGSAPFLPRSGCGTITVVTDNEGAPAGRLVRVDGVWREGSRGPWILARDVVASSGGSRAGGPRWYAVRWRDGLVGRLERLYGEHAGLVAALTLARREGLDRDLRETFARVGIAHLLAISGFHVGVIAGVALILARATGLGRRRAALAAAATAWAYVGFIGFPDAACRAALILALLALSAGRARPPARWGALGAAFLLLLALNPARLLEPGFQLSFAGAAGLVAWSGPASRALARASRGRCPRWLTTGLGAGISATLATLPVAAWHFERISLVGIPATLAAAPLVSLALVGALASLAIDFVWPGLASFLAGGVASLVWLLEEGARTASAWPWASVWTTPATVVAGTLGVAVALFLARRPGIRGPARRTLAVLYVGAGVLSWPLLVSLQGRGSAEVLMIDVGQGDAIGIRSPDGHWALVDAGRVPEGDPAGHPAVRALRRRGVRRLEALVLTHPDLDHIGGAAAVLSSFDVGVVYDPGLAAGKGEFVDLLNVAAEHDVPWHAARAGDRIELGDLVLEVLHPSGEPDPRGEANAASVVLHLVYGDFDALLTGDAYKDVDRELAPQFHGDLEVLKVGHHGSDTSTDSLLLARARPRLALVSVGRHNRYGHPSPAVLGRLERSGARIHRTDREGTVSVLARPDGSFEVRSERSDGARRSAR